MPTRLWAAVAAGGGEFGVRLPAARVDMRCTAMRLRVWCVSAAWRSSGLESLNRAMRRRVETKSAPSFRGSGAKAKFSDRRCVPTWLSNMYCVRIVRSQSGSTRRPSWASAPCLRARTVEFSFVLVFLFCESEVRIPSADSKSGTDFPESPRPVQSECDAKSGGDVGRVGRWTTSIKSDELEG